jgi:hypothetical protein
LIATALAAPATISGMPITISQPRTCSVSWTPEHAWAAFALNALARLPVGLVPAPGAS